MTEIAVAQAVVLKNRPDVEMVAVGTWKASTGTTTFTRDDLAAAVAALDCPGVRNPVLKLGHQEEDSTSGVRWDGEPAVGWVANMRLNTNGDKIIGDFQGMPAWLADVLPSAYPDRSVEIYRPFVCQIGHRHAATITAVSLLGVWPPAVGVLKSLQDVQALYTAAAEGQALMSISTRDGRTLYATVPETEPAPVALQLPIRLTGRSRPGRVVRLAFNPNQVRDTDGRWTDGTPGMTDAQLLKAKPWQLNRTEVFGDEAELTAWRLLENYTQEEGEVTPALSNLAADHGARLEGLKHRLKTQESLARKLEQKSATKGLTPKEYGKKIGDALRYTMVTPSDSYGKTAQDVIDDFRTQGYEVEVSNTWKAGASYKGINTNMTRNGLTFEVQFHTDASLSTKQKAHGLYEIARDANASPKERASATKEMLALTEALDHPDGSETVK